MLGGGNHFVDLDWTAEGEIWLLVHHEVGRRADGSLYVTQKLVHGRTLAAALADCRTLKDRLGLSQPLLGLCQAVAFAHGRGVIHRDPKPGNMMVGDLGEAVVLDWGLGRTSDEPTPGERQPAAVDSMLETDAGRTRDGAVMGTPHYMSPEQAVGASAKVDARTDVWSPGVILYELLTGTRPFAGSSPAEVLQAVAVGAMRLVRQACPDVPAELAAVAKRALARDPAARYPSGKEMAADLVAWLSGDRVVAHECTSLELVRKFVSRYRWQLATMVLVLARAPPQDELETKVHALLRWIDADTAVLPPALLRTQNAELAEWPTRRSIPAGWKRRKELWPLVAAVFSRRGLAAETADVAWVETQFDPRVVTSNQHRRGQGEEVDGTRRLRAGRLAQGTDRSLAPPPPALPAAEVRNYLVWFLAIGIAAQASPADRAWARKLAAKPKYVVSARLALVATSRLRSGIAELRYRRR